MMKHFCKRCQEPIDMLNVQYHDSFCDCCRANNLFHELKLVKRERDQLRAELKKVKHKQDNLNLTLREIDQQKRFLARIAIKHEEISINNLADLLSIDMIEARKIRSEGLSKLSAEQKANRDREQLKDMEISQLRIKLEQAKKESSISLAASNNSLIKYNNQLQANFERAKILAGTCLKYSKILQLNLCAYSNGEDNSTFCDCKFIKDGGTLNRGSENGSGCCEARAIMECSKQFLTTLKLGENEDD